MINLDDAYCTATKDGVKCPLAENCKRAIRDMEKFLSCLEKDSVFSSYDPAPFVNDTCEIFVKNDKG